MIDQLDLTLKVFMISLQQMHVGDLLAVNVTVASRNTALWTRVAWNETTGLYSIKRKGTTTT